MLLVCRERRGFSFQDSAVSAMISKATKKAAFSTSFIAKKKKNPEWIIPKQQNI